MILSSVMGFAVIALANEVYQERLLQAISAVSDLFDLEQVKDKYQVYYKNFFEDPKLWQKKWHYFFGREANPQLSAFHADGCSAFPDGTKEHPSLWRDCCIAHDLDYWLGGNETDKTQADDRLSACVESKIREAYSDQQLCDDLVFGFKESMKAGVVLGGAPYYYSPWRWGYGWNERRNYRLPDAAAIVRAHELLLTYRRELETSDTAALTKYGVPTDIPAMLKSVDAFEARWQD